MTVMQKSQNNRKSELSLARESGKAIAGFVNDDTSLSVTFARSSGEQIQVKVPASALSLLANILTDMAQGNSVTLTPHKPELTTHQAAELLHVSRPFLIKLLDQGIIEHRKVGRHRRVAYEDLKVYMDKEKIARRETLAELAAYDQEIGLNNFDME